MLVGGKATKRSRFGPDVGDQMAKTFEVARLISQSGLRVHVIDAEWRANDVSPSELEELLRHYRLSLDAHPLILYSFVAPMDLRLARASRAISAGSRVTVEQTALGSHLRAPARARSATPIA